MWSQGILLVVGIYLGALQMAYGQTIYWSDSTQDTQTSNDPESFIQQEGTTFYTITSTADSLGYRVQQLAQYNAQLQRQTHLFPMLVNGKRTQYQDSYFKDGKWQFYFTLQEGNQEHLYTQTVNPQQLSPEASPQLVSTWTDHIKQMQGSYKVGKSANKLSLIYGYLPSRRKSEPTLIVHTLKENGRLKRSVEVTIPHESGSMKVQDILDAWLLDNGEQYLLCKFYRNYKRQEERKVGMAYRYALLHINAQGEALWKDSLNLGIDSLDLVSARLYYNAAQGKLYAAGTYKTPATAGLFHLEINPATRVQLVPYPPAIERAPNPSKKITTKSYKLQDCWLQADGSYLATAEQQYEKVYLDKLMGMQRLRQHYNVLIIKWNAQGKVLWQHSISKRQQAGGDGYNHPNGGWFSFKAFEQEGKVQVFYNEVPENRQLPPPARVMGYYNYPKALDLWQIQLDAQKGTVLQQELVLKANSWLIFPTRIQLLSKGEFLFPAMQYNPYTINPTQRRWGKLVLDQEE